MNYLPRGIEAMDLVNGIEEKVESGRPRKGGVRLYCTVGRP